MYFFKLVLLFSLITVLVSFVACSSEAPWRLGMLEAQPISGQQKGHRFCITFFPSIYNLTENKADAASHLVADLADWDGCGTPIGASDVPPTNNRWVVLNQSAEANCSLDERVASLQRMRAAGMVIQVNESYAKMIRNQTAAPFPVTFIPWRHAQTLLNSTDSRGVVQYAIPDEQPFNFSFVVIWCVANFTIVLGALWSATVKYELFVLEESARRARRDTGDDPSAAEVSTQAHEPSSMQATAITVVVAICLIVTLLLLSYFFPESMYYVVLVLFFIGSVSGLFTCLNAINVRLSLPCACDLGMTPVVPRCPSCRVRVSSLILGALSLSVAIVWVVFRDDHTWGWILQDILGVAFTLSIIRSVRLPSLRIVTYFAVGLLIYDIFFVFITPLFTTDGRSIMEEVATGGGDNIMPLVLKVPHMVHTDFPECYSPNSYSLLGYGDIILPGIVVAYCAAVDKIFIGRHIYLAVSATGYALGLIITFVAVYAMETAQPALLYLVPMVLLPTGLVALCRRQFKLLWHGAKVGPSDGLIPDSATPGYNTVDSQD